MSLSVRITIGLNILIFSSVLGAQSSSQTSLGELARRAREARENSVAAKTTITNDSDRSSGPVPPAAPAAQSDAPKAEEPVNYDLKGLPKEWPNCRAAIADINTGQVAFTDVHLDASFSGDSSQSNGMWIYAGRTTVKPSITVMLPDWVNIPNDPVTRAAWQNALEGMRKHEEGHVRIGRESSRKLDNVPVTGTGVSLAAAQQQASQEFQRIVESVRTTHQANQLQYDAQTDHGRKQSVIGGMDIKLLCP